MGATARLYHLEENSKVVSTNRAEMNRERMIKGILLQKDVDTWAPEQKCSCSFYSMGML